MSEHGKQLAKLPLPPRLAHMVLAASDKILAARIALVLTEQGLGGRNADLADRLDHFARSSAPRAKAARALAGRIARMAGGSAEREQSIGATLALAFPDRVAKARSGGAFTMANGRAASLDQSEPLAQARFLVIADIAGTAARARVLLAAEIEQAEIETLFADEIETRNSVSVDPEAPCARAGRGGLGALCCLRPRRSG